MDGGEAYFLLGGSLSPLLRDSGVRGILGLVSREKRGDFRLLFPRRKKGGFEEAGV